MRVNNTQGFFSLYVCIIQGKYGYHLVYFSTCTGLESSRFEVTQTQFISENIKMLNHVLKLLVVVAILSTKVNCDQTQNAKVDVDKEKRQGCGWRNPDGIGFRIQSENDTKTSQYGEFPWMVAVLKVVSSGVDDSSLNIYTGGGSLIHPSVVLTVAHLVHNDEPSKLKTRAGEWDTQTIREIYPHQDRDVATVRLHEAYNKGTLANDIALLFLAKPMDLAPNVGLACLPPPQQILQPGTKCFASGWGKDRFGKVGHYSVILKKIEMPIVDREVCENKFRASRLEKRFVLDPSFICAGEPDQFTCKGDGGSPLVCPTETVDRFVQSGIVSWSIGCSGDPPTALVNVAQFREWIDRSVTAKGLETSSYTI